ncbi:MAG TPA: hypothetical protein VIV15_09165 [Anaerolineales bacterium]
MSDKNPLQNALNQWAIMWDQELADRLEATDHGAEMPVNASDPLEYLGELSPLALELEEIESARHLTREVIDEYGAEHVWRYRTRYKVELKWILRF